MPVYKRAALVIAVAAAVLLAPGVSRADMRSEIETIIRTYLASHPAEVQRLVHDYLLENPAILQEMMTQLVKKPAAPNNAPAAASAVAPAAAPAQPVLAAEVINSTHQMTLGDPQGETTLVEFFDYNCGFCKRALGDMVDLMRDNPRLKVVLKEMPILGTGSVEAARVAIAARMQDPGSDKLLDFHRRLLGTRGQANRETALAAAREAGLDASRIEQDITSEEVRATIEESMRLARSLGINGTPGYVIGNTVIPGAIGYSALKSKLQASMP